MSVIGIDFGSDACVIGQAGGMGAAPGRGGIDIVLNDNSKRRTPSIVSFQGEERFVGEHAEPLLRSNARNTPFMMKSLLGKNFSDSEVQEEMKNLPYKLVKMEGDHIGIQVNYNNEDRIFTPEQITAILLTRCCDLAQKGSKVGGKSDVVISVPPFWNDAQRRAMYHASQIAGVKCLRLINENVAAALDYGIFRNMKGEFTDKPANVLFVDMGYTATHATVAAFTTGKVKILSCAYDRHLGSRNCDAVIGDVIAEGFLAKYRSDPRLNARSAAKLMVAAEKTKKTLSPSGVDKAPIYIECLHDDRDYISELTLHDFQAKCSERQLPARLQAVALEALQKCGMTTSDLSACEIIGGGMRVPQMKNALSECLGFDVTTPGQGLSTTLNMDETVARGCALQCAILSPRIRVKAYDIVDYIPYSIRCVYMKDGKEEKLDIYKKGDEYPSYRRISLHSKESIPLRLEYTEDALNMLMPGTHPLIAETTIQTCDKIQQQNENPTTLISFCYDAHGLCYLYNALAKLELPPEPEKPATPVAASEKPEKEEEKEEKKEEKEKKEEEEKKEEKMEEEKEEAPKKKYATESLVCVSQYGGLSAEQIKTAQQDELAMQSRDEGIRLRNQAKNDLESYVYTMRDKLSSLYKAYVVADVMEQFLTRLEKVESWLYDDEGYNAARETYVKKLDELKAIGDPVVMRYNEAQDRPDAVSKLSQRLESLLRMLNTPMEKYDHITPEEKKPIRDLIEESKVWMEKMLVKQSELPLSTTPVLLCNDIMDRTRNVENLYNKIMSKPKPKVEEKKEEKSPKSPKEEKEDNTSSPESDKSGESDKMDVEEKKEENGEEKMEVE